MKISKRLQMIASCVPEKTNRLVDVGTDHAYIPIYLIRHGLAKHCIACDINPQPLKNAQRNIDHYNMQDNIETRLGSGLSPIEPGEVNAIIIAGMGGMLLIDILQEDLELVKEVGLLILQPQLDIDLVRRYLHSIGFTIEDEKMLVEDGKYYTIILAKIGTEKPYSDIEYLLGKRLIEGKNPILKKSLLCKIKTTNKLIDQLSTKTTPQTQERLKQLEKEKAIYKEVLECL